MAKIIPELSESQLSELPSRGEAKVYRAIRDRLSDSFVVFFQISWILRLQDEQSKDGEIDFVVCHPDFGYLCIEVKGGGIEFDSQKGQWFSVDRQAQKHEIQNPINQAMKSKYSIRAKLNENERWQSLSLKNVLKGHAVFFPDIGDVNSLIRPDMPSALIGSSRNLQDLKSWIDSAFEYWQNDTPKFCPIGMRGIETFKKIFARSFTLMPLIASQLFDQEALRLILTKDQIKVLDLLRSHRRVAVSGGAGTGKTVLAIEKSRRLASEGFRTLLTCFNRPLADYLSTLCKGVENLEVMSFHQLCYRQIERASRSSGRNLKKEAMISYPGMGEYEVQLPNALSYSVDILPDRYDAIVCDEGQDFLEDFWLPLELLLSNYDNSPLYVFYDDNQDLYDRAGSFPIRETPISLTTNCRNTLPIHFASYKYYKGLPVSPPEIEGIDVQFDASENLVSQATKIHARIVEYIVRQGVAPEDIVVLIADKLNKSDYHFALNKLPLPKQVNWTVDGVRNQNNILIETVNRFKGLEASIVILWGLDSIDITQNRELLYVGMSRAKSLLIIVGKSSTCDYLKNL